jgi:hypothetical protein
MHQKHPPAKRAMASLSSIAIDFACRGPGRFSFNLYEYTGSLASHQELTSRQTASRSSMGGVFESPLIVFEE